MNYSDLGNGIKTFPLGINKEKQSACESRLLYSYLMMGAVRAGFVMSLSMRGHPTRLLFFLLGPISPQMSNGR